MLIKQSTEQLGLTPELAAQQVTFLMKKSPIGEVSINNENYYYDRT